MSDQQVTEVAELRAELSKLRAKHEQAKEDARRLRQAGAAMLESLDEYVRQSMHCNPEWRQGIVELQRAVDETAGRY